MKPFCAVATLIALGLAACGGAPPPAGTVVVNMYDNAYSPPVVRLPEGGRVRFRNVGRNQHHAVALDEAWSTAGSFGTLVMERGDEAEVVFSRPGVYPYYCTYHGSPHGDRGMVGVVLVGDVEWQPGPEARLAAVREPSGVVRRVPADYPGIQAAVDAAAPGDLVLVDPGVYREEVRVTTPSLVLRGVDRNEVVLDGEHWRGSGVVVLADGVAVENMTARNYLLNGFYWTGVTGFRGSHLTAYNNGDYGIYAFGASDGLIEDSYASGHPDAGIYVGQCYPCRTVIRRVTSESNGLGYSGTNAGGDLYLVDSVWRRNMAGIVPNTLDSELMPPQRETVIAGNLVAANSNLEAPAKPIVYPALGTGILIAGGVGNRIEGNRVVDHSRYGILILPSQDERFWPSRGNVVRNNVVTGSGRADLALGWPGTPDNCFAGNEHATASPPGLERLQPCRGARLPLALDAVPAVAALLRQRRAEAGDYPHGEPRTQPAPPPQPQLAGGAEAEVRPAVGVFDGLAAELASPRLAAAPAAARAPSPTRAADRYASYLPLAIALVWALAALVDVTGRRALAPARRWGWTAAILALPALGAPLYLLFGRPRMARRRRLALVAGALLVLLLVVAGAASWHQRPG